MKTISPDTENLKFKARSLAWICFGLFLFLIFFLPLNPPNPDFNKKILILLGFAGITFILSAIIYILIPFIFPVFFIKKREIINHLLFVVCHTVSYVFYGRYAGKIVLSFHLVVMISLISGVLALILVIITRFHTLKKQLPTADEFVPVENHNQLIEFISENQSDRLFLFAGQIILIKAANNYIEIIYKKNDKVSRSLIRNTMQNTEKLTAGYPSLLRCHRSCIINKDCIQHVRKCPEGLKLTLFDYPQEISVSRQYMLKVKEALNQNL